ncbi:LLM class flavin-dependent oxidoreductase [Streptomyces sp. NPDC056948]|uniref:LLM class flavin-dependent oxidoreductase n=1 Tax=Streptomyces sp. NPDC056948 TaxID=3345975 RepID=UPI003638F6A4
MAIGVALPLHHEIDGTVRLAREAHEAGLRSAWFGQTFAYDSPTLAAIVGREVPGLHVGTSAIPVFGRHPLLISSQAQTAQAATRGHYHLGLALGAKYTRAVDQAVIGDEEVVAAEIARYREAGATEVVFTTTDLGTEADRHRTWKLLGELANG